MQSQDGSRLPGIIVLFCVLNMHMSVRKFEIMEQQAMNSQKCLPMLQTLWKIHWWATNQCKDLVLFFFALSQHLSIYYTNTP